MTYIFSSFNYDESSYQNFL